MIYRILGRSGSGKTEYLFQALKSANTAGKECILLVPEQQSVSAERELCALLGSQYNLKTEILNFERLPDRVFRENGGVAISRADSKTLSLFTALACENSKERLTLYDKACTDKDFTKKISQTIKRMENSGVTPKALADAASLLDETSQKFREKLCDIGEIFSEYEEILKKGYADSAGIQKKLLESLVENNFFEGKTVFIDGYYNFTPAEYPIVEMIFKGAEDTYITILYDKKDKSGIFDINKETLSFTERVGRGTKDIYPKTPKERAASLDFLEKNLFAEEKKYPLSAEGISVFPCKNVFEESECAAEEILRLVESGYRYKDIAISVRDESRFEGILDNALSRHGIPFYSAEKDELSSKEISTLILSVLEIAYTDWSTSSVIKYINSSFAPLSEKEADLLSIYAEIWRIKGRRWYNGEEWLMNPSGYKAEFKDREKEMLDTVNKAREKLLFYLEPCINDLKNRNLTITKGVRALYNHLIHIKADEALERRVISLMESGEDDEASKLSSLWDNIMSILDTLYETAGDIKTSPRRLHDLIRLMMDEYKLGALPPYFDNVEIGNASIMRPSKCKALIVLGANDGVFPATPDSSGLFSDFEKEFLKTVGINSEVLPDEHMKGEFLYFYNLCAAPKNELILTYSLSSISGSGEKPSMFIDMVTGIFGDDCKKKYVPKPIPAGDCGNTFSENVFISPSAPDVLRLSASKIEKYLKCPFSYYCEYVLSLKKYEKAELNAGDAGTYFHKIIELFTKTLFETGSFKGKTEEEIKNIYNEAKTKYINDVFHGQGNEREKYAFEKHESIILPLLKSINDEFANSKFVPISFEERTYSSYPITEKTLAKLSGAADRVDILEKDGKKYIRVIDYKTGNKTICENDVKKGFEMQMLTYLFAHCKKDEIPAGVLYLLCRPPEKGSAPFPRNGLMLEHEAVVESMSYLKENGQFTEKSFRSEECFEELKNDICQNIQKVGNDILDGKMSIAPNTERKTSPCKFCQAKPYCRKKLEKE